MSSPIYLGPNNLDTFWCIGWAWNCQIIFIFASIHGRACFILYTKCMYNCLYHVTTTVINTHYIHIVYVQLFVSCLVSWKSRITTRRESDTTFPTDETWYKQLYIHFVYNMKQARPWMLANMKIIWQFHAHPMHQKVSRLFGPRYTWYKQLYIHNVYIMCIYHCCGTI
jgi:hypothetical protein